MKRQATGFLHTLSPPCSIGPQSCELHMAVLTIEWWISQPLEQAVTMNWDQVMDHFLKVCKEFA